MNASLDAPPTQVAFSKAALLVQVKLYMIRLYGKPGEGNDVDKWNERYGLLCGFADELIDPEIWKEKP